MKDAGNTGGAWLRKLVALMPPHEGAGARVDREAVERVWGVRFPSDYKDFVAVYGGGTIENYLYVAVPEVSGDARAGHMERLTDDAVGT
ncbi:hypothetical protein [Streptomyces sp. enrichment culture]|uniref:hypothetical protein n=1 Tax=Streptomyces sp. enrichment culture TaxID=1795815 RepID=UPI003F548A26